MSRFGGAFHKRATGEILDFRESLRFLRNPKLQFQVRDDAWRPFYPEFSVCKLKSFARRSCEGAKPLVFQVTQRLRIKYSPQNPRPENPRRFLLKIPVRP